MQYHLNSDKAPSPLSKWENNPFFAPDSVVLGIDIGVEGIGIAVRKGAELLYCKSLIMELPESAALAKRRQYRAARRARKNRHTRMYRLRKLFEKHGLPWVSDEIMSKSDPFVLRYRAINGKLASKEALSICIRSVVAHRGYDFNAMTEQGETNDAGEFPWGESDSLSDAKAWIKANYIDAEQAEYLKGLTEMLTFKKKELDENQIIEYRTLIDERVEAFKRENIESHFENYVKDKKSKKKFDKSQARNVNFPRSHVKAHLEKILERHRDLIERYDDFVNTLLLDCKTKANKKEAIFHFNRKTPHEARLLYEKKVKTCPWCNELGLPSEKCGKQNDPEIILWNLLDFVSVRTFDLNFKEKKNTTVKRGKLTEAMVRALIEGVKKGLKWGELKKSAESTEKGIKFSTGEWNKQQLEQLKDICTPPALRKNKRANISTQAAKKLFEMFTENGQTFDPDAVEANKKEWDLYNIRQKIRSEVVFYPQVRTLLGTIFQKGTKKGQFATTGFLQKLFEKELSGKLDGKTVPDYCIIECIKNPARSADKKAEIEKKQKENRKRAETFWEQYKQGSKKLTNSERLRITLFNQQGGTCPFTGQSLGNDPFAPNLELAHLFPDSRGGLYMRDNLVLTTREVNAAMGNRTPYEAAQAHLPDWRSWEEMKKLAKSFKWGEPKREIFFRKDSSFPDFNNLTYTAQLARELRNTAARWMGISEDAEKLRQRIGNPHGIYTAATRKSLTGSWYEAKDRQTHTHHRVDAAVLSCLPPTGLNDAQYGGVFRTVKTNKDGKEFRQFECCLQEKTDFLPDLSVLNDETTDTETKESPVTDEPPVIKLRGNSKYKSLGDSTFWSYSFGNPCLQRCPLTTEKKQKGGKKEQITASAIRNCLEMMGINGIDPKTGKNRDLIPSDKEIEKWLASQTPATEDDTTLGQNSSEAKPLRLKNGTPVKHLVKIDAKGNLNNSPLKWNGNISENGRFDQLRSLDSANDRLEIWLGWNPKKNQWEYQKRLIPTKQCLLGIKRMGIPWRGRHNAPEYLIQLLDTTKAKDLKTLVCGTLLPHSKKVAILRKGDVFRMKFTATVNQDTKEKKNVETWMEVSALKSDGIVEFKPVTVKEKIKTWKTKAEDLASLKGLPNASEQEQLKKIYENPPA